MRAHQIASGSVLVWAALIVNANADSYVLRWTAVQHDVTLASQKPSANYVARFSVRTAIVF